MAPRAELVAEWSAMETAADDLVVEELGEAMEVEVEMEAWVAGVADKTGSQGGHTTCAGNILAIGMPRPTCRTAACSVSRRLPATARPVNGNSRPMPEVCDRQSTRKAAPCVASPRPWNQP